jgi:hypothetical protein
MAAYAESRDRVGELKGARYTEYVVCFLTTARPYQLHQAPLT